VGKNKKRKKRFYIYETDKQTGHTSYPRLDLTVGKKGSLINTIALQLYHDI